MSELIELPITPKRALKIWWSYFWRATIFCGLAGFAAGIIIGGIYGALHSENLEALKTDSNLKIGAKIVGWLVSIPVSFYMLQWILPKDFKEFRIALIAKENNV